MNPNASKITSKLALGTLSAALLVALAAPSVADASGPNDDNPDCGQSVVALEIDTSTGDVYLLNGSTGQPVLTDNEITVSFGSLGRVLVDLQFTDSEWNVDVTPSGEATETFLTRGGALRYTIYDTTDDYVFEFDEAVPSTTVPIPPIVITPDPDCPPED